MPFDSETAAIAGKKGGSQPKKRDVVTQHIIAELNTVDATTGVTRARMLAKALVDNAIGGDSQAQRETIDRAEGKARQQLDVTHEGELTLKSAVVSQLDSFFAVAAGRLEDQSDPDVVPN